VLVVHNTTGDTSLFSKVPEVEGMMISTDEQRNSATFEKDGAGKSATVPMSLFVGIWFITKKEIELEQKR